MLQPQKNNSANVVFSILAAGMITASATENFKTLNMPPVRNTPSSLVIKPNADVVSKNNIASTKQSTGWNLASMISSAAFLTGGALFARGIYKSEVDNNKYTNLIWTASSSIATLAAFATADKVYGYSQLAVLAATVAYTSVALVKYKTWAINKLEKICTATAGVALSLYAVAKFGSVSGKVGEILNNSSLWLTVTTAFLGGLPLWSKHFRKREEDEIYKTNWQKVIIPAIMPWCCFVVARTAAWISTDGASVATSYSALAMLALTVVNFTGQFRSSLVTKNTER